MQTSGLVIQLVEQAEQAELDNVLEHLRERSELTLGDRNGRKLPAVLESDGERSSVDAVRGLEDLPGIARVDVVFVGTDDEKIGEQ